MYIALFRVLAMVHTFVAQSVENLQIVLIRYSLIEMVEDLFVTIVGVKVLVQVLIQVLVNVAKVLTKHTTGTKCEKIFSHLSTRLEFKPCGLYLRLIDGKNKAK